MSNLKASLKELCQKLINNIFIHVAPRHSQAKNQDNTSQINCDPKMHIDLDQQSQAFGLFHSDPHSGYHWIRKFIHQQLAVHSDLSQQQQINQSQFLDFLSNEDNSSPSHDLKIQEKSTEFDGKYKQYQFFNQIPPQSLLISSLIQISQQACTFIVRNFHGQIVFLSIHPFNETKISIVSKFCMKSKFRALHLLLDDIDYVSSPNTEMSEEELKSLTETSDLIYLRRQANENLADEEEDRFVRYCIKYNSLFQKYKNCKQVTFEKEEVLEMVQKFLLYFFELIKEQLPCFAQIFYEESFLKQIIKINYKRRQLNQMKGQLNQMKGQLNQMKGQLNQMKGQVYQKQDSREIFNFANFIKSEIFIYQQMQLTSSVSKSSHFPKKLSQKLNCLYCLHHQNQLKITLYQCIGCFNITQKVVPLCPECFEHFHSLQNKQKIIPLQNNQPQNNPILNLSPTENEFFSNTKDQNLDIISPYRQKMESQKGKKKVIRYKRIKKSHKRSEFTESQIDEMISLKQSGQKLLRLFSDLRNYQRFYHHRHSSPSNQQEYKQELGNQLQFMKTFDILGINLIQMFQGEVMIAIFKQKQKEKNRNKMENIAERVKFQDVEEMGRKKSQQNSDMESESDEQKSLF